MLLNCSVGEDSWESFGLQGDQTSQSYWKSVLNVHWRTDVEAPILWPSVAKSWQIRKDPDARKDWRQEEKGTTRGWDGWMESPTQWTWVWASSGRWWRTGKPGVLQSMGFQRVGHNWVAEQQQLHFMDRKASSTILFVVCVETYTATSNSIQSGT